MNIFMLFFYPTCSAVINGGNIACNMQVMIHLKQEILLFKEGRVVSIFWCS